MNTKILTRFFCSKIHINPITTQVAATQFKHYCSMPNESILYLSILGDQNAREERLIREIMSKEEISWHQAQPIFQNMLQENRRYQFFINLPYNIGIFSGLLMGFAAFPMIFNLQTAQWFNEHYVTSDVPEPHDLESIYEVSNWSWNWMEPPLGTISFFILCMQMARNQLQNLALKPYTEKVKSWRAKRILRMYPKYDDIIVKSWSKGDSFSAKTMHNEQV